uniref:Lipase n=1 Tax=Acrobeloides nanus TaxID=290746 RepID=A0A914CGN8_9BILA
MKTMWFALFLAVFVSSKFAYGLDSGHDPEINMTTIQMAQFWGYLDANIVSVTTQDGYILEMHHIPYGRNQAGMNLTNRPVVFIQHGLEAASDCFTWNLPNESLALIFADYGFDVWLGNVRGNRYAKKHVSLDPSNHSFWQFSWDEMVKYDLETMIDTVLNKTGASSLYYVGHSQGTLIMFSRLASDPNFHTKIKAFFAMAPVGTVRNIDGLLGFLAGPLFGASDLLLDILGPGEFLPHSWLSEMISEYVCSNDAKKKKREVPHVYEDGQELCENILFQIMGPNSLQNNASRTPVYTDHVPAGTSTQNMLHWIQMVHSGLQQAFDYGSAALNNQHYGSPTPPIYNISNVNAPTYLYWSDYDYLADETDIKNHILPNLNPNILKGNFFLKEYDHSDFVKGLRAPDEIYHPMAKIIMDDFNGL